MVERRAEDAEFGGPDQLGEGIDGFGGSADAEVSLAGRAEPWAGGGASSGTATPDEVAAEGGFDAAAIGYAELEVSAGVEDASAEAWPVAEGSEGDAPFEGSAVAEGDQFDDELFAASTDQAAGAPVADEIDSFSPEGATEGDPFEERSIALAGRATEEPEQGFATEPRGMDTSADLAAASLEEIARQLRSGEVRVGAIDSMAEPPAILAAVLAAMLAHRR